MFSHMFLLTIPWIEKILRPIIVYAVLVVLLRIFGKRELAQLNPFDLVVLLSLSNTVQNAIIGDDNTVAGGLIGAVSLLSINYVAVRFLMRHRRLDQLMQGQPTTLIERGRILKNELAKELMTIPELITVAHRQGFKHLKDIDRCVLEPGGVFSITPKPDTTDHFSEVVERLKAIQQQLDDLRRSPQP